MTIPTEGGPDESMAAIERTSAFRTLSASQARRLLAQQSAAAQARRAATVGQDETYVAPPAGVWRVGNHCPRNVYAGNTDVGRMDTPALAALVVESVNRHQEIARLNEILGEIDYALNSPDLTSLSARLQAVRLAMEDNEDGEAANE